MGSSTSPASLRRRYGVVGFALVAVGMVFGGVTFYRHKAEEVRRDQFQILAAIGKLKFEQLESWRKERVADARRVARGPLVRQRTGEFLNEPSNPKFSGDLLEQLQLNRMDDVYSSTLLLALDGRVLLSTDGSRDVVAPATRGLLAELVNKQDAGLSDFFQHIDGITHVDAAAAVRDAAGRPLAIVVLRSNADVFLFPLIQSWPLPSRTGETALAFRSGEEALIPHKLRFQSEADPLFRQPLTRTEFPAVQAVLGRLGPIEGRDYRGEEVLAETRSVPGSPWVLVNKIDKNEAYAELRQDALFIASITGALILLAGAMIAYYYRQRQVRGFQALYESERRNLAAERALHTREAELELALSAAHQGLYDYNIPTGEGTFSAEYATMLGYDPATFHESARTWFERMHPDDRERVELAYNDYLDGRSAEYRVEFRQRTQAGEWKWILSLGKIIERTVEGKPWRMLGTRTDINELKRAEAALRESEIRYRTMVEWTPEAAAVHRDGIILYANPACVRMLGANSVHELVGLPFRTFIHPDFLQMVLARVHTIASEGRAVPLVEERFLTLDGRAIDVEVQGTPIHFDGRPAVFTVARDITSRKRAEAALKQSEERYRAQFDLASEGILTLTPEGQLLEVNEAFARMHGYTRAEMLQLKLTDLDTPESTRRVPERMRRLLAGEPLTFEVEHFHKSGHTFPLEVSVGLVSGAGGPTLLCFHRDITERKRTEAALRMTHFSVQSARDALFWITEEARIVEVNEAACRSLGYTRDELVLMSVPDVDVLYDAKRWPEHFAELRRHGSMVFESEQRTREGVVFPVEIVANYLKFGDEERNCAFVRDITERRWVDQALAKLQAQLQQTQKMESLGSLAGGVAHDMNNVLGAILGLATAHLEIQATGTPIHRALDTISKAALRGGKLVRSLLDFARKSPAEERELDLNAILTEEVRLLERTTLSKVRLELDLAPNLRLIHGDANALNHAFMNLCVNAVDAMPEQGTLTLRTCNVDTDWVEVVVEDTGTGMAREVLDQALNPFYTTKAQGKGTGLGLSMVFSTVASHRGQLELQSEPGQGTRVRLRFPACEVGPADAGLVAPADSESKPAPGPLDILLVDDDELIRSSIEALLEVLDHRAIEVASGEAALAQLEAGLQVDLVILDMNMPGLGGAGTLPRLRALRPDLPVLLATGRVDQAALDLVAAFPHVNLLAKPFGLKDLQQRLEALGITTASAPEQLP